MNIGIDIDGTLSSFPKFFITLGNLFKNNGHNVFLITGLSQDGAYDHLDKILKKYNEKNNSFILASDFCNELITTSKYNLEEINFINKVPNNELIVGIFKQRICREKNIDIMFDDQADIHLYCGIKGNTIPIFKVPK